MTDSASSGSSGPDSRKQGTVFFGKTMIAAIIGIVALLVILLIITGTGSSSVPGAVPPQTCADRTLQYVNANLVQPGTTASLVSVSESHGIYQVSVNYLSRQSTLYTTKDCSLLFMNPTNMDAPAPTPAPTKAPVKSPRPVVNLYVMAFCPFGTQAETAMAPVHNLLGSKADIQIRYITTVQGASIDSVSSLHGISEAKEDAFQLCVRKEDPSVFWEYLRLFNTQCYPKWSDSAALDACRKNVTATLKMNHDAIATCAAGTDALGLLRADEAASNTDKAGSSPTLIINGVEYSGARTPEAYKQAICNSFETVPAECSTTLSTASATAAGSC